MEGHFKPIVPYPSFLGKENSSSSTRLSRSVRSTLPCVRAHRVRVHPPKKLRSVKSRYGEEKILRNPAGRTLALNRFVAQFRKQDGTCPCGHLLLASEAKFESKIFRKDEENRLICSICQKARRDLQLP